MKKSCIESTEKGRRQRQGRKSLVCVNDNGVSVRHAFMDGGIISSCVHVLNLEDDHAHLTKRLMRARPPSVPFLGDREKQKKNPVLYNKRRYRVPSPIVEKRST